MQPAVSVIIPTFGRPELCAQALESVGPAAAGALDYEILLIDDGSSAQVAGELAALAERTAHCRHIRLETNCGPQVARNMGIEAATGCFIKFLDSDDLLLPGSLAVECRAIESLGSDVLVSGWLRSIRDDKGRESSMVGKAQPYPGNPYDAVLAGFGAPISAVLYRRTAIGDVRWDPVVQHPDDWFFLIRVLLSDLKVSVREAPAFLWRHHPGPRQSSKSLLEYAQARFHILDFFQRVMEVRGELTPARRQALADYFYRDIYVAWRFDRGHYRLLLARLDDLVPDFQPSQHIESRWTLRQFGKVVGYRRLIPVRESVRRLARLIGLVPAD